MDTSLRNLAFTWLAQQVEIYGDVLDRKLLEHGFIYDGNRISFVGPQGIWKPKSFTYPLSCLSLLFIISIFLLLQFFVGSTRF